MISGNVLKGQKRKMEKVERKKQNKDINYSDLFKFQHRNKIWISQKS